MTQSNWQIVTPSEFPHERRALDFIAATFPDHDPYRAWANFEFTALDGALYEVDLLVLTKQGFWLVEIKSRPGRVEGDAGTWTWTTANDRKVTTDNPVHLLNKKAKVLSSLLKAQPALRALRLPFLEPLVFLSADDLNCRLAPGGKMHVCRTDRPRLRHRSDQHPRTRGRRRRPGPGHPDRRPGDRVVVPTAFL